MELNDIKDSTFDMNDAKVGQAVTLASENKMYLHNIPANGSATMKCPSE